MPPFSTCKNAAREESKDTHDIERFTESKKTTVIILITFERFHFFGAAFVIFEGP
jgi:hypothetical protein